MTDDPSTSISRRRIALAVVLLVGLAVLALAAGVAVTTGAFPALGGGGDGAIEETELASLQTWEPRCGTHRSSNGSVFSRPADGGYKLSINATLPVAARDSTIEADFSEIGPDRYRLDLQRSPGTRSTDCYLEMRYNATVNLTQREEYTLLLTVEDRYHRIFFADPGSGGASNTNRDPRPPSMNDSEWHAALNASDAYVYNRTGGASGADGSDGGGATDGSGGTGSSG